MMCFFYSSVAMAHAHHSLFPYHYTASHGVLLFLFFVGPIGDHGTCISSIILSSLIITRFTCKIQLQGELACVISSCDGVMHLMVYAACYGQLETAKLLMVYGADLNARTNDSRLPIDVALNEEIRQAIRDEPRRRIDEAPGKRATEQDRHPDAATLASAQGEEAGEGQEHDIKQAAGVGEVADEDQDSEPSSNEEGGK